MMRRFQINKLNSHANPRFHDSNHAERFNLLVPACEGHSDPGIGRERPARANECPAHGDVGGYTFRLCSAFQVQQLNICRKRIANTVPAVAYGHAPRVAFQCSVVHGDYVTHSRLRRVAKRLLVTGALPATLSLPHGAWDWGFSDRLPLQKDNSFGTAQAATSSHPDITWNDNPALLQTAHPFPPC